MDNDLGTPRQNKPVIKISEKDTGANDDKSIEEDSKVRKLRDDVRILTTEIIVREKRLKLVLYVGLPLLVITFGITIVVSVNLFFSIKNDFNDFRVTYDQQINITNAHGVSLADEISNLQETVDRIYDDVQKILDIIDIEGK